jgi:hypothetical protein
VNTVFQTVRRRLNAVHKSLDRQLQDENSQLDVVLSMVERWRLTSNPEYLQRAKDTVLGLVADQLSTKTKLLSELDDVWRWALRPPRSIDPDMVKWAVKMTESIVKRCFSNLSAKWLYTRGMLDAAERE